MKKEPGIYIIYNKVSQKLYVGSSTRCVYERMREHKRTLNKSEHPNSKLQRSWDKHKEDSFEFYLIERCIPSYCVEREQYWMDLLNVMNDNIGYNIAPNAGSSLGQKRTDQQKQNIKDSLVGLRQGEKNSRYGKTWSQEQRDHFRKVISTAKPVLQIDIVTSKVLKEFGSIRQAAEYVKGDKSPISKVCRNIHKHVTSYSYKWKFKN